MSGDLFGVTLPKMIRELERALDEVRMPMEVVGGEVVQPHPVESQRRIEILLAAIARLKRGSAEAA